MVKNIVVVMTLALSQGSDHSAIEILTSPEPLTTPRVEEVLAATAIVVTNKSFFTYGGFGGGAITIGEGPRVRYVYYGDRATEWPGVAAKRCDGGEADGELELDWERVGSSWRATARASTDPRILDPMFELWHRDADSVEDAGFRELEGVKLRGLRFPYEPPEGASFEASWQVIWFDTRTALPTRYEIEIEAPESMDYGYFFAYAPQWEAGPPSTLERPDCLTSPGRQR